MGVPERLVEIREKHGYTRKRLADELGRPYRTVTNYETGEREPGHSYIVEIAKKFGVTTDYILGASNSPIAPDTKKEAPSGIPEEALQIAKDYDRLTDHGKGAVKAILGYEAAAAQAETAPPEEPSKPAVVPLPKAKRNGSGIIEIRVYDQPAAAGLGNYLDEPDYHLEQYPDGVIPDKADFGIAISGDSMEPKIHHGGTVFVQAAPSIDPGKIGIFILNGQAYCKKLAVDRENRQVRLVSLNPKYEDIVIGEADEIRTVGRVLGQWTPGRKQDMFGW